MIETIEQREEDLKMFKRRLFRKVKSMTQSQFDRTLDGLFDEYYNLCDEHYKDAMNATLPPRFKKALSEKHTEVKELWNGMY